MEIKHDKEQQKFYFIENDKECYVKYMMDDSKTFNVLKVFVHPDLRNHGLAGILTKTALEFAKGNNLKVIPTCSYADSFILKNKEYKELLF
jgi:predicted GNAT family acetyltransferase